jgi:hypothetical protein
MDLSFIPQLWDQITHSSAPVIIGLILNVGVFLWRSMQTLPNRWIPHICVVGGMVLYPLLGDRSTVPAAQPHPVAFMSLLGMILGFLSWAAHGALTKVLGKYFPDLFPPEKQVSQPTDKNEKSDTKS